MGYNKDYNEVIFAGKQADEARCGWMRLKRRPEKSRVPESPIYLAVVGRRRPSTHSTLRRGSTNDRGAVAILAKSLASRDESELHPCWHAMLPLRKLRKEAWKLGLENPLRTLLFSTTA
jgi:hypothetical protein